MSHKFTAVTLFPIFNRVGLVQNIISSLADRRERGELGGERDERVGKWKENEEEKGKKEEGKQEGERKRE